MNTCSYEDKISNCQRPVRCKGLCKTHSEHVHKYGSLRPLSRDIPKWFSYMSYVLIKPGTDACWEWTGAIADTGYGVFQTGEGLCNTHRFAWTKVYGSIPDGIHVDHRCHNRKCVNVHHLRLVSPKQNTENHSGATKRSSTGVRGVYTNKKGKYPYRVQIRHMNEFYFGGYFTDLHKAEQAAIELRNRLHTHNDKDRI